MVLDDLVLDDAHAGLLHGHLGQGDTLLVRGHGGLVEDLVHLLLGERRELGLRGAHLLQALLQRLDAVDDGLGLLCHASSNFPRPLACAGGRQKVIGRADRRTSQIRQFQVYVRQA